MNRFFYYLILINMITSIVATNPKVLLHSSDKGSISSMILAVFAGLAFTYAVTTFFNKFPGEGLPELLTKFTSKWFSMPILIFLSTTFYLAGLITLITYTHILKIFLTPEMSIYTVVSTFILFVSFGILMKTRSVLYTIEIILVLFSPIFLFMIMKAYTSSLLEWDIVRIAMMHINHLPNLNSFATAFFILLGSINLVIFNRTFTKQQTFSFKSLLAVAGMGITVLFTMYFIPIGYGGFDKIKDLIYPWISTTDSMRMKFGLLERVTFIFMLTYLGIALLSIVIHWHTAYHLFNGLFPKQRIKSKKIIITQYLIVISFWVFAILLTVNLTEYQLFEYTSIFDKFLPIFCFIILITFSVVNRGAKSQ